MRCPACKDLFDLVDVKFCPTCGASLYSAQPDPLLGQTIGGRYKVQRLLAEGGMGRVYVADQELGGVLKKVAIKVLLSDPMAKDADTKRFERECRTVAELEHPNTIKFFDFGTTDDGDVFIAMEFLSGSSLAQILKGGPLFPERVDLILGQICGSLQEAHDRGIVHRDIKPDNIILTSPGGAPDFVKVLDFGIAKRMGGRDPKLTPLGVVLGSPPYMSPEQFTLQDVDHKSDIYSLGIVAYQLLTGVLPFNASDPLEWAALHMGATPTPIDAHGVAIPPAMGTAIHRALSKQPHERPSTMREFYSQLTIGAGSLMPGRASSVMPLAPSQFPLPPRTPRGSGFVGRDSEMPDSDDVGTHVREDDSAEGPSTQIKVQKNAETIEAPRLYSDSHVPSPDSSALTDGPGAMFESHDTRESSPPIPSLEKPAVSAAAHSMPIVSSPAMSAAAVSSVMSSGPAISAHEISSPDMSLWNPESQDIARSTGTTALRSGKGTLVMAASEPPPKRARHTMPDLLPPTIREPVLVQEGRPTRSIIAIAVGLVLFGAIATAIAWFGFLRPADKPQEKRKATTSPSASAAASLPQGSADARAPIASTSGSSAHQSASGATSAASATPPGPAGSASKERMSPCQTAIFSAVSGNCEVAKRAFARCDEDSPYRASATRSVTGLCP